MSLKKLKVELGNETFNEYKKASIEVTETALHDLEARGVLLQKFNDLNESRNFNYLEILKDWISLGSCQAVANKNGMKYQSAMRKIYHAKIRAIGWSREKNA